MSALGERKTRTQLYHRYSRASELPLLILAVLMVPVLLLPETAPLTPEQAGLLAALDWFIYACFAFDFLFKISLAPSAATHIKQNWLDIIILLLPLLRPLRLISGARLLRAMSAIRLLVFLAEGARKFMRVMRRRGFHVVLTLTLGLVVVSASLMALVEREALGGIRSFGDALWWAIATITTVGYGDTLPATVEGRGVAVFLMITGVVFYSILTANMAAFFLESNQDSEEKRMEAKLDLILRRLDALEAEKPGEDEVRAG